MKVLVGIIVFLILILFGVGFFYLSTETRTKEEWFIPHDQVRGSAMIVHSLPYTLNFLQQEALIHILNSSKKVKQTFSSSNSTVSEIILYRFDGKSDLVLTPQSDEYALFSVSGWDVQTLLKIADPSLLQKILATSYDHDD